VYSQYSTDWGGDMLEIDDLIIEQDAFRLRAQARVAEGRKVVIMGASGAGKSTLVAAIAGFVTQKSGAIRWKGDRIDHLEPAARPIAMLFQDGNLFPHLTVAQNVALGLGPSLKVTQESAKKVEDALGQVGLSGFGLRKPGTLSGGEQSRVALARILVMARPILVMDEPFSALGPAMRVEMLDLVRTILETTGATLLMVSHDPKDAWAIADDLIVVAEGTAHQYHDAKAVLADPPPALSSYLG
jgi:thiamine transport system ATP-binding protein